MSALGVKGEEAAAVEAAALSEFCDRGADKDIRGAGWGTSTVACADGWRAGS